MTSGEIYEIYSTIYFKVKNDMDIVLCWRKNNRFNDFLHILYDNN